MPVAKQVFQSISENLIPVYGKQEAESLSFRILEELFNTTKTDLILNNELTDFNEAKLSEVVQRLQQEEPIQYIFGKADFYGLVFNVNSDVLIPRPETEELVDWIIEKHQKENNLKILDIGTGSGCIPVSIKKHFPGSEVHAIDVSKKALEIARHNADSNQTEIIFHHRDILEDSLNDLPDFNLIISNPPYVLESEKGVMNDNVLNYEPELALFVPNDNALKFYSRIAKLAKSKLVHGGSLYFEINERCGAETVNLLEKLNYINIHLKEDMQGKNRMAYGMNI